MCDWQPYSQRRPEPVESVAGAPDETCELAGYPCCPGGPAPLVVDPYDEDVNNTHRMARLHDECAHERAMDI